MDYLEIFTKFVQKLYTSVVFYLLQLRSLDKESFLNKLREVDLLEV